MGLIASRLHEFGIQALLIIGGFEVCNFYIILYYIFLIVCYLLQFFKTEIFM